jgi:O-phosphoseryl-tRNA synthetase
MKFNPHDIKKSAKSDFRKAWLETKTLIPSDGGSYIGGTGNTHIMHELIAKVREIFLGLGFDEIENQVFIPEEDVYKQYGPEAPVILDRCYYLGGLTRPDIGLGADKITEVKTVSEIDTEKLKSIFRRYRESEIEGDNVLETMVGELKISTDEAAKILDLFPEFKDITPVCGKMTLRSHMTAAWFPTISAMKDDAPLKLFSVGLRFRREQKVDASHLRAHYGGSCIIMGEDISLSAGRKITEEILNALDFGDVRFVKKSATSNYYAPDTEYEVYSGDIEVADIGMYSPVALSQYDIGYNVFNLGFGLERILMVKNKIGDVREVLYPQFYQKKTYSDLELAQEINMLNIPETIAGKALAKALKKTFKEYGQYESPCSFLAYDGNFMEKKIKVSAVENEEKSRLCGPAAFNDIYAFKAGVYGLPKDVKKIKQDVKNIVDEGVKADIEFIDAVTNQLAYGIEQKVKSGDVEGMVQVKMAKTAAEANISVSNRARRFIESKNMPISIKGPIFCAADFKVF